MRHLACVVLPAFPLQWLLRGRPAWQGEPVAVVAEVRPQARLLWVNEKAWQGGARPGQRLAATFSLVSDLKADAVSPDAVREGIGRVTSLLWRHAPGVEASCDLAGVFWIAAEGLIPLYRSWESWAEAIREELYREGLEARIAVGFTRFGTYALARVHPGCLVAGDPAEEKKRVREVPLERLDLPVDLQDTLSSLSVTTVGQFLRLPENGVQERFGKEGLRWHRQASGKLDLPLDARREREPMQRRREFPYVERDASRLLAAVEELLPDLLAELARHGLALAELVLELQLENRALGTESLSPAAPTLEHSVISNLLRLRFESLALPHGVEEMTLRAVGAPAARGQLELFLRETRQRRDADAGARALARLRALLGESAVVRARLLDHHLPEKSFRWEPFVGQASPRVAPSSHRSSSVRRFFQPARPLNERPQGRRWGPYLLCGDWWDGGYQRDYYFLDQPQRGLLWVYRDCQADRWFIEGRVE